MTDDILSKVTFRPKRHWKSDCLFCSGEATLEAVSPNGVAQVRCCEKKSCKIKAARLALLTSNGKSGGKPH